MSIANMKRDINKAKNKLCKAKLTEDFGQAEVRKIGDKYAYLQQEYYSEYSNLISNFSEWCSEYTPY